MRGYQNARRLRDRKNVRRNTETESQYCSTCGARVAPGEACCRNAVPVPMAIRREWNGDQRQVVALLERYRGVRVADKILLELNWSEDRLLRWGRKLGTQQGAVASPYLYTDNNVGLLVFLTPRAREAR